LDKALQRGLRVAKPVNAAEHINEQSFNEDASWLAFPKTSLVTPYCKLQFYHHTISERHSTIVWSSFSCLSKLGRSSRVDPVLDGIILVRMFCTYTMNTTMIQKKS
jgi:hypothetical protein